MILRRPTDTLITGFAPTTKLRVAFADVTETTHAISDFHGCSVASECALAQTLAASALLAAPLARPGESVAVRIDVPGPVRGAYAECSSAGHLRGYVCRKALPDSGDDLGNNTAAAEASLFGDAMRVKAYWSRPGGLPDMKSSFHVEPASFRRLVETYYLGNFHLPTWARIGIMLDSAGVERAMALMLQCMPGGDLHGFVDRESTFSDDEKMDSFFADPVLEAASGLLDLHDLAIERVTPLSFRCDCSREQSLGILASQPEETLRAAASAEGSQVVTCQFCGTSYEFKPEDIRRLLHPRGPTH